MGLWRDHREVIVFALETSHPYFKKYVTKLKYETHTQTICEITEAIKSDALCWITCNEQLSLMWPTIDLSELTFDLVNLVDIVDENAKAFLRMAS